MKITRVTARAVESRSSSSLARIEVETNEGVSGSALLQRAPSERFASLSAELLVDEDPRAISFHWQRLAAANERMDRALSAEIAALDVALWDLRARLNGEPLWRTLGGMRPKANVHVRLPHAARSGDAFQRWCANVAQSGVRGVVVDATADAGDDASIFVALRDALGAGAERSYLLDAKERWSPKEAIRAITAIERVVDLTWIEAPTGAHDFLGLKRIVDAVRAGVCSGGRLMSAADFLPHLHHRSLNIVQLDVARVGITATLQIADAAYGFELPITLTASLGNLHVHVASALPYCASVEWSTDDYVASDVQLSSGWAVAGDLIGHGISVKQDDLARAQR